MNPPQNLKKIAEWTPASGMMYSEMVVERMLLESGHCEFKNGIAIGVAIGIISTLIARAIVVGLLP